MARYYQRTGNYVQGADGRWYEWVDIYEYPDQPQGFGFVQAVAIPIAKALIPAILSLFGAHSAQKAQEKKEGQTFEAGAVDLNSVFAPISAKLPVNGGTGVTVADLAAAQDAFNKLDAYAQQYPTSYISQQWNSPSYKSAYQHDLQLYQADVASRPTTSVGGAVNADGTVSGAQSITDSPYLIPGLIVVAAWFLLHR